MWDGLEAEVPVGGRGDDRAVSALQVELQEERRGIDMSDDRAVWLGLRDQDLNSYRTVGKSERALVGRTILSVGGVEHEWGQWPGRSHRERGSCLDHDLSGDGVAKLVSNAVRRRVAVAPSGHRASPICGGAITNPPIVRATSCAGSPDDRDSHSPEAPSIAAASLVVSTCG